MKIPESSFLACKAVSTDEGTGARAGVVIGFCKENMGLWFAEQSHEY